MHVWAYTLRSVPSAHDVSTAASARGRAPSHASNSHRHAERADRLVARSACRSVSGRAQRSRTSRSAASTRRSSSNVRCPTLSPRRPGSTAVVCSASTRVTRPLSSICGRKLAGRAEVDVGATSQVESGSWSDWTTTAYRGFRCSCPRASRGARSRWTSPRTQALHVAQHLRGLRAVLLVCSECFSLSTEGRSGSLASGIDQGRTYRR